MVGIRKVCINADELQAAHHINAQLNMAGDSWHPRHPIEPKYASAQFSFRNMSILDWMIDPNSEDKDIIIWLQHRGELRFQYDPALEAKLQNIFAALE